MKLYGDTIVLVPWFDHEGMKQWYKLTFTGEMNRRFMYSQIAKFIKKEFNKSVSKAWIKASCPIINEYHKGTKAKRQQLTSDGAFTQLVQDWIGEMESNEDEDRADYLLQTGNPEGAVGPVRPVPDTNN